MGSGPSEPPGFFAPDWRGLQARLNLTTTPIVSSEVADPRKVIQIQILHSQAFALGQRLGQRLVLHLQLDLVHLQFMQQAMRIGLGGRLALPGIRVFDRLSAGSRSWEIAFRPAIAAPSFVHSVRQTGRDMK